MDSKNVLKDFIKDKICTWNYHLDNCLFLNLL